MIVLDSSCWLEYFLNAKHAESYAAVIEVDVATDGTRRG